MRVLIGSELSDKDVAVGGMMELEQGPENVGVPWWKLPKEKAYDEASRGCKSKRRIEEPKRRVVTND